MNSANINLHDCRCVAGTVVEWLGDDADVEIVEDGRRGFVHTWIVHDRRHYDAECIEGVTDHRDLPFFQRYPEAAIHMEPSTVDPASLRQRGTEPLYPEIFTFDPSAELGHVSRTMYWKYALAGLLLGGVLTLIGVSGEWALHHHLFGQSSSLRTLFIDLEIIGEMILVISPIVSFVLLATQREQSN